MGALTGGIVLVRVVRTIGWTGRVDTPECTTIFPCSQPREISVGGQPTLFEGLCKILVVDVIVKRAQYGDGKIVMSI